MLRSRGTDSYPAALNGPARWGFTANGDGHQPRRQGRRAPRPLYENNSP